MSRGDRQEDNFLGDDDHHDLLKPKETIQQADQRVHLGTSRSAMARLPAWMQPKAGVRPRKTAKGDKK